MDSGDMYIKFRVDEEEEEKKKKIEAGSGQTSARQIDR